MTAGKRARPARKTTKQDAQDARRAALLKHARAEIAKHGIHGASLNEVARRAGGSKATIVKLFGNKNGLFSAVITETVDALVRDFDAESRARPDASVEHVLADLGGRILRLYLMPEALATYRMLVGNVRAPGDLARTFYETGHMKVVRTVATVLARECDGRLRKDVDLEAEAGRFTHALRSGLYERSLLGLTKGKPSGAAIDAVARDSARALLRGLLAASRSD